MTFSRKGNGLADASILRPGKAECNAVHRYVRLRQSQVIDLALCHPPCFFREVDDMDIAGFRLHPLKGELRGRWSIPVNGNWRITFEFRDGNAYIVDYEDYH